MKTGCKPILLWSEIRHLKVVIMKFQFIECSVSMLGLWDIHCQLEEECWNGILNCNEFALHTK